MQSQIARLYPKTYLQDILAFNRVSELTGIYKEIYQTFLRVHKEFINDQNLPKDLEVSPDKYIRRRYPDVHTVIQPALLGYPAAKVDIDKANNKFYVLAEGPYEDSLNTLLRALKNMEIPVIFAVGSSQNGEKYYDYLHNSNSKEIPTNELNEFFENVFGLKNIPVYLSQTQFKFYQHVVPDIGKFYVINIPNWPDHGLPEFSEIDKLILGYFYLHGKNACMHCSAGIGRAATLLMAAMAFFRIFQQPNYLNLSVSELCQHFENIIREVKQVKPGVGDRFQVLSILGLAEDAYLAYKHQQKLASSVAVTPAAAGTPTTVVIPSAYFKSAPTNNSLNTTNHTLARDERTPTNEPSK